MKKTTVQISFDANKLKAIHLYMKKKNAVLQPELDDALQKLYEKYVPPAVREYIESGAADGTDTPARTSRANTKTIGITVEGV